jgi:membrane protein
MKLRRIWTILKAAVDGFIADDALSRGAAIAYYSVFAIAPILVIVIAVAGLVFGQDAAQNAIVEEFRGLMGAQAATLLQQMIRAAGDAKAGVISTLIGLGTLLLSATGVFGEMQSALNMIWKAKPKHSAVAVMLRARLVSLGLVLSLGFVLIASLATSAALSALAGYLRDVFPGLLLVLSFVDIALSLGLTTILIGAIYKFLPDTPLDWQDVTIGAIVTALLLAFGKWLIGLYIGSSAVVSVYGAASALVVVLLWVYYCSQIFLFGAEITYAVKDHAQQQASRSTRAAA